MVELSNLYVRSFDLDHLDLFWEFADVSSRVDRYSIYVDRSPDGPEGPWREIAGPFRNTDQLRDPEVSQTHRWRTYFYRLRVLDKDTNAETIHGPVSHDAEPDLIAMELRRRMELICRETNGKLCVVYPIITKGFRCPRCFDSVVAVRAQGGGPVVRSMGRQQNQNCTSCFDTTFVGGYRTPIASWVQIDSESKSVVRSETYEKAPTDISSRLSSFPPIKPKDMIVEAETNIRWEVQRVASTKKGRAIVHQEPVLHAVPRSDIRYRVPVNLDPKMEFGPEREKTRPMSLGNDSGRKNLEDYLDRLVGS